MDLLHTSKQSLGEHWTEFNSFFHNTLRSDIVLLDTINQYLLQHAGKQLRPLLTLMAAKLCGTITPGTYVAASAVEMIHTASLLHDDVVDNADLRRGVPTVKALWKSQAAVLTGDYWLSRAFQLVIQQGEQRLVPTFSTCLVALSEGELYQMSKAQSLDTNREDYYNIIGRKTASLMSAGMVTGAMTANGSDTDLTNLYNIGYELGLAFQIRDDIFDYTKNNFFGKPTGIDIREQKITLPLICALNNVSEQQRCEIISAVKKAAKSSRSAAKIVAFVKAQGGIETAQAILQDHINAAVSLLSTYPDNDTRQLLIDIAQYLGKREK